MLVTFFAFAQKSNQKNAWPIGGGKVALNCMECEIAGFQAFVEKGKGCSRPLKWAVARQRRYPAWQSLQTPLEIIGRTWSTQAVLVDGHLENTMFLCARLAPLSFLTTVDTESHRGAPGSAFTPDEPALECTFPVRLNFCQTDKALRCTQLCASAPLREKKDSKERAAQAAASPSANRRASWRSPHEIRREGNN